MAINIDLCLKEGSKMTLGAMSEWNLSLEALHWILAFEHGGMTIFSVQNTRALIPCVLAHCAMGWPSYVKDIMSGAVQTVPILNVLQKLWPSITDCDN